MKNFDKYILLYKLYEEKFVANIFSENVSSPLLINPSYASVNTDIMFVGQETNSYYGAWPDFVKRGIHGQMEIYKIFMEQKYPTMNNLFFKYIHTLMDQKDNTPIWNNLFKFDLGDSTKEKNISKASSSNIRKIQDFHMGLLSEEIKILKPKIIIFFTGHLYDHLFFDPIVKKDGDYKLLFQPISELVIEEIDEWKCCELGLKHFNGFEDFQGKAYRTYHPLYLNRTSYKKSILEFFNHEIKQINMNDM